MNPYGDPNSVRGRAQVPGAGGGYEYDDAEWREPYSAPSPGRASAPPPSSGDPAGRPASGPPNGRAPVGRATVGRATVAGGSGGYTYDDEPANGGRPRGSASVGAAGRVSVPGAVAGRASVPVPPAGPGGPGGPRRPGGPDGPGSDGPGPGRGRSGGGKPTGAKARKIRRRNLLIGGLAIFIMLAGGGVVGGTWFYDEVPEPKDSDFDVSSATTILYNDGKTQLAKLGEVNREVVPISQIPKMVQDAVVAAEDRNFYQHSGIDYKGIARAAWNNVTGGDTQGASTITQQYARRVADLGGITYARKIREAVLANKLESELDKDEILYYYLNAIYFGRGAWGIQAAAQTFFSKSIDKVTTEEAAVLAGLVKQPEPDATNGTMGFDPAYNEAGAKDRWGYVLNGLVEMGKLPKADRDKMQYPKVNPYDPKSPGCAVGCGIDKPTGNVVNYVRDELAAMGIKDDWKTGGYQVTTSINPAIQASLEKTIRRESPGSELAGQPDYLMAAAVAVDPNTGQVVAYYGGENGTGTDFAGTNTDEKTGKVTGGHSPGSSFKIYTLAAALKEGVSMQSHWDAEKNRDGARVISNADRTTIQGCSEGGKYCTLAESTLQSFNVPFYWLTKQMGVNKVIDAAYAAGVRHMWTDATNEQVDLAALKGKSNDEVRQRGFDVMAGFGQYGITVLDHANGVATFAARGVYRPAHFVVSVKKKDAASGQWKEVGHEKTNGTKVFDQNQIDDITATLANYPSPKLANGRASARKTGTWELNNTSKDNGDAWEVGFTPQLATAVWVGLKGNRDKGLKYARDPKKPTQLTPVQGGNLPAEIFARFMNDALKDAKRLPLPTAKGTGNDNHEWANGVQPTPTQPPPNPGGGGGPDCNIPIVCPPGGNQGGNPPPGGGGNPPPGGGGGNGGGGNGGGGNGGGGGQGGGILPPTTGPDGQG